MKKKIWVTLLVIFSLHLLFRVVSYGDNYLQKFDGKYWEGRYFESQWVVKNSKNSIGDDGLYAYHGWKLINGGDPSIINPEVPPFGKYLIGLTIYFFQNNNVFGLISGGVALFSFYLFNTAVFKNKLLAFIPVFIFSLEPLFYEQLRGSFIDLLFLSFLFLTFYFFLKRNYWMSSLCMGLFASVKFSPMVILIPVVLLAYIFFKREFRDLQKILASFILAPIVLLISYAAFFQQGRDLTDFLKLQKYIFVFYAIGAKPSFIGMVFPMLFSGQWYTWWNGVLRVREWTIIWPLAVIVSVFSITKLSRLFFSPVLLCALWSLAYLVFLLFVPVFPRYLLLLLPFLYNVSVWILSESIPKKYLSSLSLR